VTGRQAAAPAGPAPESLRLLVTQSLSQPDDPPSTQSVLWSAARRVRPRRTAPHGAWPLHPAPCATSGSDAAHSARQPHGELSSCSSMRALRPRAITRWTGTTFLAVSECVGQCVHSPLGPDTRPVAGVACSEPTEVRRGGGELVSDTVKWC
jgi:hypothetical protein